MKYFDLKGEVVDSGCEWIYDWYGIQAISPKIIQKNLNNANGDDVTFRVNSGGGSVFAGCDIYNMLMDYRNKANVNIEINNVKKCLTDWIKDAGMDYEKGRGYYRYYGKEKFIEMIKNKGVI